MTFVEALKTGRPFRRASWWQGSGGDRWLCFEVSGDWWWAATKEDARPPDRIDMLADDWEVKP